ncbi:MAG TPA: DUF262 domain-containing HNH endonuclease family protein [Spirochaetia bacterium]|nr:DUF262 domain-containing HNH endonuclease family protein [Spirochaetia bacterium]
MAKTILLNTRTSTFLDLLGNGKRFKVPAYQRDYSWEEEQWEDLWNDILELRGDDDSHYMGALVLQGETDREFAIIDGQQRLATLSIAALAIIARISALAALGIEPESNKERAAALRGRFIGEKDPASLIESPKLRLNDTDDAFYQDYLIPGRKPANPRGLRRSNRSLWECSLWFSGKIISNAEIAQNGKALASLLSETIARKLLFIEINVDDELNAYTVFETLNARGLELSATDLLKNYLFSRVKVESDLRVLQRRWKALVETVRQERFPEFLRFHLQCEIPHIRTQRLFKIIREKVKSAPEVFALTEELENRAELYSALSDPEHEYWIEFPDCKPYIRELTLLKARQVTPLLFAAWERLTKDDFKRTLKCVATVTFRYSTIGARNANALEPIYHSAAKALLAGHIDSPAAIFAALRSIYVEDDSFKHDFEAIELSTSGSSRHVARYILYCLEEDASGIHRDPETDSASIEHILPENPTSDWETGFAADDWPKYVYRLGNLSLLEPSLNRSIGNFEFAEKRAAYAQSSYRLSSVLAESAIQEWSPAQLSARQKRFAERAVHIWRSDFA